MTPLKQWRLAWRTFRNSPQTAGPQPWLATPGGGFHYTWDEQAQDWRDTKSQALFQPFLVAQLAEHAGVTFQW